MLLEKHVSNRWLTAIKNHPTLVDGLLFVAYGMVNQGIKGFDSFLIAYSSKLDSREFANFITHQTVSDILVAALSHKQFNIQKQGLILVQDLLSLADDMFSPQKHQENLVVKLILQTPDLLQAFNKLGLSMKQEVREAQEAICSSYMPEEY